MGQKLTVGYPSKASKWCSSNARVGQYARRMHTNPGWESKSLSSLQAFMFNAVGGGSAVQFNLLRAGS
jgi:hypothetical protein